MKVSTFWFSPLMLFQSYWTLKNNLPFFHMSTFQIFLWRKLQFFMIIKVWCDLLIQDFYTVLELLKVGCFTHLITIKKYTFWKESLNSDGQQFHQYERKKPITSHLKSLNIKTGSRHMTFEIQVLNSLNITNLLAMFLRQLYLIMTKISQIVL